MNFAEILILVIIGFLIYKAASPLQKWLERKIRNTLKKDFYPKKIVRLLPREENDYLNPDHNHRKE